MRPKPGHSFSPDARQQLAERYLGKYAARSLFYTPNLFQISDFVVSDDCIHATLTYFHEYFAPPQPKYPSQADTALRPFPCMFFLLPKGLQEILRLTQQAHPA